MYLQIQIPETTDMRSFWDLIEEQFPFRKMYFNSITGVFTICFITQGMSPKQREWITDHTLIKQWWYSWDGQGKDTFGLLPSPLL